MAYTYIHTVEIKLDTESLYKRWETLLGIKSFYSHCYFSINMSWVNSGCSSLQPCIHTLNPKYVWVKHHYLGYNITVSAINKEQAKHLQMSPIRSIPNSGIAHLVSRLGVKYAFKIISLHSRCSNNSLVVPHLGCSDPLLLSKASLQCCKTCSGLHTSMESVHSIAQSHI